MSMKAKEKSEKTKILVINALVALALFSVYFFLMFMLRNRIYFRPDEYDNILGGMVVANGGEIYRDYFSQHTPLMYYYCALLYALGIREPLAFRLVTYAVMSAFWTAMYFRYKKYFGRIAMTLYPLFYIAMMYGGSYRHTIVSEQFESQGLVILLMEFLIFTRIASLKISNCIWISLGIALSVGTAFVAVYPIFVIAICVFVTEAYHLFKKSNRENLRREIKPLFGKGFMLVGIIAFPFVALLINYAIKGNVGNAIYGIYTVNRVYYSKYNGGFGSSILRSFVSPLIVLKDQFKNSPNFFDVNCCVIFTCLYSIYLFAKKRSVCAVGCLAFLYMTAMRSTTDIHGLPFLATGMLLTALVSGVAARGIRQIYESKFSENTFKKQLYAKGIPLLCVLSLSMPFLLTFARSVKNREFVINQNELDGTYNQDPNTEVIDALTKDNEKIYDPSVYLYNVDTDNLPAACPFACPWFYDAFKDQIIPQLEEAKPLVVLLLSDVGAWGYDAKDFAPEMYEYIYSHYTSFADECGLDTIYVLNERYDEAAKMWREYKAENR